ncbi:MAG TPA: PRC-barrel domain-containing protein, partial [Cytophagaceae bacterium]
MNESQILTARSIIGDKVRNAEGVELGEITEILINSDTAKVEYGVLSFGGFLGVGNKNIAVPYEAFTLKNDEGYFVLNVDQETLENAT